MLGTRGCRLGHACIPEIYEMQVRAIVRAALGRCEARGVEIMHPLVGFAEELRRLRALTEDVIERGGRAAAWASTIGTMIEVPRAALTADEIAERGRLLLVRHQRPHPDDAGVLARRRRGQFLTHYLEDGVLDSATRSRRSTSPAWAS